MRALLNDLKEKIGVINTEGKILFANQAFLKALEVESLLDENIEKYIEFKSNAFQINGVYAVKIIGGDYTKRNATAFCYEGMWEQGKVCYIRLEITNNEKKAELLEQMMDKMVPQICINDLNGEYIYANQNYGKAINKNPDHLIGQKAQQILDEAYYAICTKEDDYVIKNDSLCVTTEWIKEGAKEKNYRILRIPLKSKDEKIDHIGYVIYDNTCTTEIEMKVYEVIKQFEGVECIEEELPRDNDTKVFSNLKEILKQYMETPYFNIWSYDESRQGLTAYFESDYLEKVQEYGSYFPITKDLIEKEIKEQLSPVYIIEQVIDDEKVLHKLKQDEYHYIVIHPIYYRQEFTGLTIALYKHYPSYKVIKNDSIVGICNRLGVIIHEQKVAQRLRNELIRRRQAERELQGFLDISADIMGKIDGNKDFIRINKGLEAVLGWEPEQFLQKEWENYIHPEDLKYLEMGVVGERKEGNLQNRYRHKNGQYRWFQWHWKYTDDYHGGYFVAKDITEYKEWEQRQKKMDEVLQLEEVRKEFFANVSHELRTPLAILMGVHQLIQDEVSPQHYNMIKQNTNRLLRLINNLIDITKIDAGYYQIEKGNYNIISLVEELVISVVEYARHKDIEVLFDTEVEEEILACDKDQMERIILNLLSNAIKYNVVGGKIEVEIHLTPLDVEISVLDTGVGIPQEQIPFIFERFMQVDNVLTRKCEGSGIGLSLVKALVEMHEGHITVISEAGQTIFKVTLPRKQIAKGEITKQMGQEEPVIEKCGIELSDIQIR